MMTGISPTDPFDPDGRCTSPGSGPLVREVLALMTDRWSMPVVAALEHGPVRFTGLMREIDGISHRMLTKTLRTLERDGIVARTSYPESPPRVEYELTDLGRGLSEPVGAFVTWTLDHRTEIEASRERFDSPTR